jgi:hypothetical protein
VVSHKGIDAWGSLKFKHSGSVFNIHYNLDYENNCRHLEQLTLTGRFGMATIPGPGGLGFAIAAPYHGTVLATHGQVDLSYSEQQMFLEPKKILRVLRRVKLSVALVNFPPAVNI